MDSVGDSKRENGLDSYYTPVEMAKILADWAITSPRDTVFDPSFGGCAFITGALEALRRLGSLRPGRQIYGVDIDREAAGHLERVLAEGGSPDQFCEADFFALPRGRAPWAAFDAVLGNPPYLRHHRLSQEQRALAAKAVGSVGMTLSGRSSYWAYFVVYALGFVRRGGRLAMVLPGAFLHADYATPVRQRVIDTFGEVEIYLLQERVFEDVDEESVIVCGKNALHAHRELRIGTVRNLEHLAKALHRPETHLDTWSHPRQTTALAAIIPSEALDVLSHLKTAGFAIEAGDWVRARIGVVTGSNKHFILSSSEVVQRQIPVELTAPILRRASHAKGLFATDDRLSQFYGADGRSQLLVLPPNQPLSAPVRAYLELESVAVNATKRAKCRGRTPWYAVPDTESPSAFLCPMAADWPRIIVNQSRYTCTNNIYRLEWGQPRDDVDWLRFALGALSSVSQLSAELVGRSYGGGVLKLEPGEFTKWVIPVLPTELAGSICQDVDSALLASDAQRATEIVDSALVDGAGCLSPTDLQSVRAARDLLRDRRRLFRRIPRRRACTSAGANGTQL